MNLEEYKIELLSDFDELINFYTGKDKMDDFLHNHLQDCEESHYCKTFPALEIAYLAIDKKFQSLHLGSALIEEIASMARNQRYAGCVFLTVRAWHTSDYSAVGFYEKNQFAKLTPVPQMDVWPMYKTIWPKE